MAIVVEEEGKPRQNFTGLITGGIVFVVVALAVYYVFFKRPDLVDVATPTGSNTAVLSQINLQPDEVINSPAFQALHPYTQPIATSTGGGANPFLGSF